MADNKAVEEAEKKDPASTGTSKKKEQKRNIISRIWNGIFRVHGDDFEKRLKYISKEEAAVLARIKRRAQTWRLRSRQLILFSLFCEVLAVGFAVMMTRSTDLDWKMRAVYVLPVFIWPVFSYFSHSALVGWTKRRDLKDQKTLERLRAERQAKINELKERTNYYSTQQLIQRYDPDPAAKAAAATVLASKLGAESGLKVYLGDESTDNAPTGKSNDVEVVQSGGLRNRKQPNMRSTSTGNTPMVSSEAASPHSDSAPTPDHNQVVDHHIPQGQSGHDGGWISRIAALLVGEDPTQSYALICGNCRMHNGLARKEEFPFITYYCPHCHALNRPKESAEQVSGTSFLNLGTLTPGVSGDTISTVTSDLSPDEITALTASVSGGTVSNPNGSPSESILTSSITAVTGPETEGESEKVAESDVVD